MTKSKGKRKKKPNKQSYPSATPAERTKPGAGAKQLVITLTASNGRVGKIEQLGATGKRRAVSDAEFMTLVGDDDAEDLFRVIEDVYAAGFRDGFEDTLNEAPFVNRQESVDDSAGAHILQSGLRRLVLRRVLRRSLTSEGTSASRNGAQDAL